MSSSEAEEEREENKPEGEQDPDFNQVETPNTTGSRGFCIILLSQHDGTSLLLTASPAVASAIAVTAVARHRSGVWREPLLVANPSVLPTLTRSGSLSRGLFQRFLPSLPSPRRALGCGGVGFSTLLGLLMVFCLLFLDQRRHEAPEGLTPELRHLPKARHQAEHPAPQSPGRESAARLS